MIAVPARTQAQASMNPAAMRWPKIHQPSAPARTGAADQISATLATEVSLKAGMNAAVPAA